MFYLQNIQGDEFLAAIEKQKQGILNDYDEAYVKLHNEYEKLEKQLQRENLSR